ncbi:MAG: TetR/AcrR family transcriptional regulator [Elusimicrobiota bacterium]|jgi:AcrR family transcriptional regulator|nr:TetR/AcrR family transcriptional regulator [Elusimicrobiota bacterium]
MTRPSKHIDKKLIEAGKACLFKKGIRGINVRAICVKHRINLGMFFYYFRSKKNFIREIFISFVEDTTKQVSDELANISSPIEKMRRVALFTIKLHREKHENFESIIRGLDFKDRSLIKLRKTMIDKWRAFFKTIADGCRQGGYISDELDTEQALSIYLGGIHTYSKFIDEFFQYSDEEYYEKINKMSDILESKIKKM